jgi:hypothetical protein
MGITVETEALRHAAQGFTRFGRDLNDKVLPAMSRCTLPSADIPAVDLGFRQAYAQSWEAMDLAAKAAAGSMLTIGNALTMVANHYEGQDNENARMFHGQPIPPPTAPAPEAMDGGGSVLEGLADAGEVVGAVAILMYVTVELCLASALIGALMIVQPVGIFCIVNLKDPVPYFTAAGGWSDIEQVLSDAAAQVPKLAAQVTSDAKWSGDAADAFTSYVSNDLAPVLGAMQGLAASMKQMLIQTGFALLVAIGAYVIGTLEAAKVVEAADADPEPVSRESIGLSAIAVWLPYVMGITADLLSTFGDMAIASSTIESALRSLKSQLSEQDGKIQSGTLTLSPARTTAIQSWQGWSNPKVTS